MVVSLGIPIFRVFTVIAFSSHPDMAFTINSIAELKFKPKSAEKK